MAADGDRNLAIDRLSATFQPQTNYRWPKTGDHPKPLPARDRIPDGPPLRGTRERIPDSGKQGLSDKRTRLPEGHRPRNSGAGTFSWERPTPFIVLPSFMVGKSPGQPGIGALRRSLIVRGKLYPAILGDLGPGSKIGRPPCASAVPSDPAFGGRQASPQSSGSRLSRLPGTAEKPFSAPDYARWASRCRELWKEIGEASRPLGHEWASIGKPWPTPSPSPSPSATAEPSPADGTNPASSPAPAASNTPATSTLPSQATNQ